MISLLAYRISDTFDDNFNLTVGRAAGISISIRLIPAIFDGIRIGQVCYTSTSSVVCALLSMKIVLFKVVKLK